MTGQIITHHVSRFTHHASLITFHASRITNHVSRFTHHHASRITNHASRITNHASRITNHVSLFPLFPNYFLIKRLDLTDDLIAAESIVNIALALRRKPISKRRIRNQPQ